MKIEADIATVHSYYHLLHLLTHNCPSLVQRHRPHALLPPTTLRKKPSPPPHTLHTMDTLPDHPPPGGFIPPTLPSPPPSSITSPSQNPSTLPQPRAHPLKPGSAKESSFISFVDQGILNVTRRYAKRFSAQLEDRPGEKRADADAAGRGYEDFGEVARELEELVDVVWVSGTRTFLCSYSCSL